MVPDRLPKSLIEAATGITAIDDAVRGLYETGYMHNHIRMYVASIAACIGKYDWQAGAHWFYYHLFDGDIASNTYSWQWVAGVGRSKKYIANQDNINKFCYTKDSGTFLDCSYEELAELMRPEVLKEGTEFELEAPSLQTSESFSIDKELPTLIYNYYNLDPTWHEGEQANRVFLFEPEKFEKYPDKSKSG